VAACAICAGPVEQSLRDIFPESIRSVEPYRIRLLDFDNAKTSQALDPQHVVGHFRKPTLRAQIP
jgi:hypothetical protein